MALGFGLDVGDIFIHISICFLVKHFHLQHDDALQSKDKAKPFYMVRWVKSMQSTEKYLHLIWTCLKPLSGVRIRDSLLSLKGKLLLQREHIEDKAHKEKIRIEKKQKQIQNNNKMKGNIVLVHVVANICSVQS